MLAVTARRAPSSHHRFWRRLMKILWMMVAAIALAVPALSMQAAQEKAEATALKPLPPINLQDFDGKPVSTDSLKGNILILDFWATWCVPCLKEVPEWNRLQAKYADKGVKVVGVTLASGDVKDVQPVVDSAKMKYTVLMGDDDQTYDLNIVGFPTTYLITRDLKIYRRYMGASPFKAAQIEADIQKLLAQE
jgi:thiol-disulfide isomerase/thioredoxin